MLDVESLERATLAAVPPREQEELGGWLLGLDDGTVGRARSAAPLRHGGDDGAPLVRAIEARYRAHGLPPVFRVPRIAAFALLREALVSAGYAASKPTLVQAAAVRDVAALPASHRVELAPTPSPGWADVFLGAGFDPHDGASRLAILQRASHVLFASVQVDGAVRAVGCGSFSHGWCSVHGMRTAPAWRGRGLATAVLGALAREAQARGIARAFLQVEEPNERARSVYARAGFSTAWPYDYWKQ